MTKAMITRTLSVTINRPPAQVYEFVRNPENLPHWAPAFSWSVRRLPDGKWLVETTDGTVEIRFVADNEYGVLDHYVRVSPELEICNPMRVLANGQGSVLLFTLFQREGMADDQFADDAAMVGRDLQTLKKVLEESGR